MPYTTCRRPECGCDCPSCGERGDLCTCSQAQHDETRRKRLAGVHEEPVWSPAHYFMRSEK